MRYLPLMAKTPKVRLDVLLVEKNLVESRAKAQALILAGQVVVNNERIDKPGHTVPADSELRLKDVQPYVSRGGLKLAKSLATFAVQVENSICLDVGASTGGFTDCLLKHGAKKVYAVDVGHSQLHWSLVTDPRVISLEKINFRHMDTALLPEPIDLCVMDVSFISIEKLLPKVVEILTKNPQPSQIVFLIKPQFETSPQNVGKGGIVKDQKIHDEVTAKIQNALQEAHFHNIQIQNSPIQGADGNEEFLVFAEFSH